MRDPLERMEFTGIVQKFHRENTGFRKIFHNPKETLYVHLSHPTSSDYMDVY
jgi:hypothetical protein